MPSSYKQSSTRVRAFRHAHRVGQRLSGRLLRWQGKGLGLVDIQGHELTALIASHPDPGQILQFVVESLYPNVILRELHSGAGGGASPAVLLADFRTARMEADEALKDVEAELPGMSITNPDQRKNVFHELVSEKTTTLEPYIKLMSATYSLNDYLSRAFGSRLSTPNWLLPGATSRELVEFTAESGQAREAHFSFYLSSLGRCEIRIYYQKKGGGFRVLMEEQPVERAVAKIFSNFSASLPHLDFQGSGALPPESKAGVLARMLRVDLSAPFSFDRRI